VSKKKPNKTASRVAWIFTGLLFVVIVLVVIYARQRKPEEIVPPALKMANVETMTIKTMSYTETLTLPARIEADQVAALSAEFAGMLTRWLVPEGAPLRKGQTIAVLDQKTIKARLDETKALLKSTLTTISMADIGKEGAAVGLEDAQQRERSQTLALEAAEADLKLAQLDFSRTQKLVIKKVLNQARLDSISNQLTQAKLAVARVKEAQSSAALGIRSAETRQKEAETNLEMAQARVEELKAAIVSLKIQLQKTNLKAPIAGKLEKHLIKQGEFAGAGKPLAYIYDARYVRATVNVPDRYVSFLDTKNPTIQAFIQMNMPGAVQRVKAELIIPGLPKLTGGNSNDLAFDAKIARISQAANAESNTYKVELRLLNPGGAIRHGLIGRGRIEYLYYPEAIVIPVRAAQVTDEGPRVLLAEDVDGIARVATRDIEAVSIRGDQILVGSGLKPQDRLIVAGWKGLVPGEAVNVLVADGQFLNGGGAVKPTASKEKAP
jgi:RND family efflux transporter MFP subunit